MEMPQIYRPMPRRPFDINTTSNDSSYPPSPGDGDPSSPDTLSPGKFGESPSRTRSILNLTSSTLLGIYSPVSGDGSREESSTPWGTGAQTPIRGQGMEDYTSKHAAPPARWAGQSAQPQLRSRRKGFRGYVVPLMLQTALLFGFGVAYGSIITHLHKTQQITPVPIPNVDRSSLGYQISWGIFGVLLGNALPLVDSVWEKYIASEGAPQGRSGPADGVKSTSSEGALEPLWYSAVRSIGAFVGIAFAVRRLPWQSTLQVALTLALANPLLWYLIDRTLPGFAFSAGIGSLGSVVLLVVDPDFVPLPAIHQQAVSEKFGVYTWLASILFCTSLCFGAIGRRFRLP